MPRVNAKILTTGIHIVFRGLKSESDTGIGQKGAFFKGLETSLGVGYHAIYNDAVFFPK